MVVCTCHPNYAECINRRLEAQGPDLNYAKNKARRSEGVAEVVGCLPSKCKALSSNPSTAKKKREKKKEECSLNQRTHSREII
jgi:protein gp37